MRISDWSSDVCSSDLPRRTAAPLSRALPIDGLAEHRHTAPELHPAALDRQMGLEIAAAFGRVAMSFPYAADRRQPPENLRTEKPAIAPGPVGILAVARASQTGRASGWERVCQDV